jgi:hypothetical protein
MTPIQVVALVVACVWLAALTLVVLLLVRQLGLVTLRLDLVGGGQAPMPADGPEIGEALPAEVTDRLPELSRGRQFVLLISPTCVPCHEIAPQLVTVAVSDRVTTLVPGRQELADELTAKLPPTYQVVRDPVAAEVARTLQLERTPSAVELRDGVVSGKAYLYKASDLQQLVDADSRPTDVDIVGLTTTGGG